MHNYTNLSILKNSGMPQQALRKNIMKIENPQVGIIMGSKSDWETIKHTADTLEEFNISFECHALSAHRNPQQVHDFSKSAKNRGIKVIIAAAGMAAALPGVVAAITPLPVLGVPIQTSMMGGLDSLLSMVQMPGGIPVGTLATGKAGAKNAALLAISIIALSDKVVATMLDDYRNNQNNNVAKIS